MPDTPSPTPANAAGSEATQATPAAPEAPSFADLQNIATTSRDHAERDQAGQDLREMLRTGQGLGVEGDDDDTDDVGISHLVEGAPEPEDVEDEGEDEEGDGDYAQLQAEHDAMQQYYGGLYAASQQLQETNRLLNQQLAGHLAVDTELAQETIAQQQAAAREAQIPDPETDPAAHMQWMIRDGVRQEMEAFRAAQQQETQQTQQQETQQKMVQAIRADLQFGVEDWPELEPAYNAYLQSGAEYYQGLGQNPGLIHQAIDQTLATAAQQGQSPAVALYNLVGAHAYHQEEPAPDAVPQEPETPAQQFIDAAESSASPAAVAAVAPTTPEARIQEIWLKAGTGDRAASVELMKHAKELGDPRDPSARAKIMRAFGTPM